jgi:hypothetical protein
MDRKLVDRLAGRLASRPTDIILAHPGRRLDGALGRPELDGDALARTSIRTASKGLAGPVRSGREFRLDVRLGLVRRAERLGVHLRVGGVVGSDDDR